MEWRQRAADQSRRPGAGAEFFNGLDCGFLQNRVIGETEIIVGREINEDFAADLDARTLRGIHAAQFAEQILFADGVETVLELRVEIIHGARAHCPSIMLAETVDA